MSDQPGDVMKRLHSDRNTHRADDDDDVTCPSLVKAIQLSSTERERLQNFTAGMKPDHFP